MNVVICSALNLALYIATVSACLQVKVNKKMYFLNDVIGNYENFN